MKAQFTFKTRLFRLLPPGDIAIDAQHPFLAAQGYQARGALNMESASVFSFVDFLDPDGSLFESLIIFASMGVSITRSALNLFMVPVLPLDFGGSFTGYHSNVPAD